MAFEEHYLDLVKRSLTGALDIRFPENWSNTIESEALTPEHHLRPMSGSVMTMLGRRRLDAIQLILKTLIAERIPGDILIAGCWRGGLPIFCQACLHVYEPNSQRKIWCADSFVTKQLGAKQTFPLKIFSALSHLLPKRVNAKIINKVLESQGFPRGVITENDLNLVLKFFSVLPWSGSHANDGGAVEDMLTGFRRYGLWSDNIKPLKGWFNNTLPQAPITQLALLYSDGDFYQSTLDSLQPTYPKVVNRGVVVIDDYGALADCKLATDEFRAQHQITEPLIAIDHAAYYWVKQTS